jgi:O-antigen biosynthesis protein
MRRLVARLPWRPRVSLLATIDDPDEVWIRTTFASLRAQIYPDWELCACDNGSVRPHVAATLRALRADRRLKVKTLPEPAARAEALAAALAVASGELCALVGCGDELAPDALFRAVEAANGDRPDIVYTDEVVVDEVGEPSAARLKPSWSPDLLLAGNYLGRLCVIRRDLVEAVGGPAAGVDDDEVEHDLLLRVSERARGIRHLPAILYRRRTLPPAEADPPPSASARAARAALRRRGEDASVRRGEDGWLRVERRAAHLSTVAAIVRVEGAASTAPVLRDLDGADAVDEIVIAGGRRGAFPGREQVAAATPAHAITLAAARTTSEFLLLLDGRGRPADRPGVGWIDALLAHAERSGVGAVGCRLLYRDGRLRQGGTLIDLDALTRRSYERMPTSSGAVAAAGRPFNPDIVRADCMMVSRARFDALGGLDSDRLGRSLYDVDFTLRLAERGLLNVYTPAVTFVCGVERELPPPAEVAYLWERWWERLSAALSCQHPAARLALRDAAPAAVP